MALKSIPENSRVYRAVSLVIDCYEKNIDYRKVRELVVEQSKDLGFFQAPANVAFVVLGLLYGEGDFKKSIIYTVNCGDDTDCTAGTAGAILGIVGGTEGIPEDWREYVGDRIVQMCLNAQYGPYIPTSCEAFTDRVIHYTPEVMKVHKVSFEFTDGEDEYDRAEGLSLLSGYAENYFKRSPYSFDITRVGQVNATVEFDGEPVVRAGGEISFKMKFKQLHIYGEPVEGYISITTPDGWSAEYRRTVHIAKPRDIMPVSMPYQTYDITCDVDVRVSVGENVLPINRLIVTVELTNSPMPLFIPITLIG
jgi:hypothetical protein